MYPILYKSDETNFAHNGIGLLRDAITVYPEEELNGLSEITIEYDADGFLANEIKNGMIIKAKANDKQQPQLFRIYSHVKDHVADRIIINGQHITYDLADNFVETLILNDMTTRQAMEAIKANLAYPTRFNITSTNNTTVSSTKLYRTNPLQMVAGIDGSILDHWGGQIERDNFNLIMHRRRGSDDGVKVLYKKNLTGLQATFDDSNVVTRIFPFKFVEATEEEPEKLITIPGKYIDSTYINNYDHINIQPVDASNEEGIENSTDLYNAYKDYFNNEGRGKDLPSVSMEVEFEHLHETEEYKDVSALEHVGMGDTITVGHSKWGLDLKATIVKIEYDSIAEKNRKVSAGNVKASFTDSVNNTADIVDGINKKVDGANQKSNEAIRAANGKNTIYYGPEEPTGDHLIKNDVWFRMVDDEYTRTYIYDGVQWQLSIDVESKEAKETAAEARNQAQNAVDKADLATSNAVEAIEKAQEGFDKAQDSMTRADSAFNKADALSTVVDKNTGDISSVTQIAKGLQTKVSDAEGNISTLQQTAISYGRRIESAESGLSTLTQTAQGLQTIMEGISSPGENLVINGGFENGHFGWSGTGSISTDAHSGENSLYIGTINGNVTIKRLLKLIPVIPGNKYETSFWYKTTSNANGTLNNQKLRVGKKDGSLISTGTLGWNGSSTSWTKASKVWTCPADVYEIEVSIVSNHSIGSVRWDDVSIVDVTDREETTSRITQLSNTIQARLTNAEGDINTLTLTASSLQSTIKGVRDDLEGLEYENRNLIIRNDELSGKAIDSNGGIYNSSGNSTMLDFIEMEADQNLTFSQIKTAEDSGTVTNFFRYAFYDINKNLIVRKANNGEVFHDTTPSNTKYIRISYYTDNKVKLERGTKATGWGPSPEDMATQSQISQLSDNINLRVQKNDIINQINISTESILISGKKLILDGDTTVNGSFRVKNANITDVNAGKITAGTLDVGKISLINLIGLDIYGSRFSSANGNDTMYITGGHIRLMQNNGRYVHINPSGLYGYNAGGSVRFQADSLLVTSRALGTSTNNVYLAAQSGKEARVVDMTGLPSDGEIASYTYLPLRADGFYGNYIENNAGSYGNNIYIRPRSGGELRVTGAGTTDAYYPLRAGALFSNTLITTTTSMWLGTDNAVHLVNKGYAENSSGDPIYRTLYAGTIRNYGIITHSTHGYFGVDGELRVVNKGLGDIYRDIRGLGFIGNRVALGTHINGKHFHVQPAGDGETRITTRDGSGAYRPIRAAAFPEGSSEKIKENIVKYDKSALNILRNSVIYEYNKIGINSREIGFIIERETPNAVLYDGESINGYSHRSLNTKAIQELDLKVDNEVLQLKEVIERQAFKIADLEQRIHNLEVA